MFNNRPTILPALLLITIGAACVIGLISAFCDMLIRAAFGHVAEALPDADTIQAIRILIGITIICFGMAILFRKNRNAARQPGQERAEPPDTPRETEPPRPIQGDFSPTQGTLSSIDPTLPVFIHIFEDGHQYAGRIHQGGERQSLSLSSLALDESVTPIPGKEWTLRELVEAIIRFKKEDLKAFDERVQLDLGHYLYNQTLGRLPEKGRKQLREQKERSLRILTDNEWIAGLPWNLLASGGVFFSANNWSISLCQRIDNRSHELPPSPRMLIIAPEPPGLKRPTRSEEHLEELEDMLSSHDPRLSFGDNLKVAKAWEEFLQLTASFEPELIYYYGHGVGDRRATRLVFETGPRRAGVEKPILDVAQCLRCLEKPPKLAYINCCLGDAGGFLGAGMQLGDFIPAVITNRTVAEVPVARAQAMTLWKTILLQGIPPHKAVSNLYADMDLNLLSTKDCRWITPVLHAHYSRWTAEPPRQRNRISQDPHWHLKIDRVNQYNAVIAQTRLMLREQKPKSLVFVWYGQEGQGIETFHKRLLVELREELTSVHVHQVRPRWPEHIPENYHDAFSDILTEVFAVNTLEDIPVRLRSESHGRPTLLYVRHEPVRSARLINPESLKWYVRWWDRNFAPLLEKKQFAILTVSFLVSNPPAFVEYVENEKIEEMQTRNTVFWLLDEMEKIAKRDLLLFLQTHNIDLPEERRDEILRKILKKTGGHYEKTVEQLKNIWREAYSVPATSEDVGPKTFDY